MSSKTEQPEIKITMEPYLQAGGPEVYPNLEPAQPIAVKLVDNGSSIYGVATFVPKVYSDTKLQLHDLVDLLNKELVEKARKEGITHIFNVQYAGPTEFYWRSAFGKHFDKREYTAVGCGYKPKGKEE